MLKNILSPCSAPEIVGKRVAGASQHDRGCVTSGSMLLVTVSIVQDVVLCHALLAIPSTCSQRSLSQAIVNHVAEIREAGDPFQGAEA